MTRSDFYRYLRLSWLCLAWLLLVSTSEERSVQAFEPNRDSTSAAATLAQQFRGHVLPFLADHCRDCHGVQDPEGALDLSRFQSARDVTRSFAAWELIVQRIEAQEMPPTDASTTPSEAERSAVLAWTDRLRADLAARHQGDPGNVLARRLSAAEYNYTIRDLTGVDIRPAAEFPLDPSNAAGFDNSGESLTMTPSLLRKYIDAARQVASHLLFLPDGLRFAPHPVVAETDRDKYCVRRIIRFYQQQNTEIADYLLAAWQLQRMKETSSKQLRSLARRHNLSPKYLAIVWQLVESPAHDVGPIRKIRTTLRNAPEDRAQARKICDSLAEEIRTLRQQLTFDVPHLRVSGINRGSQPLVLWRNRKIASQRMTLNVEALADLLNQPDSADPATAVGSGDQPSSNTESVEGREQESEADRSLSSRVVAAYRLFCRVFPDAFYVDRRGREYLGEKRRRNLERESEVRLLSAGFHSMMGYFRDDQPLCELVLSEAEQQQLDRLWFELDFVADAPRRQHAGFIWFERAEGRFLVDEVFDDFRSEDKNAASESMIRRLSEAYLAKAKRLEASARALQAIRDHFDRINASIRSVEDTWPAAREAHLRQLLRLAGRAYRRPLTAEERDGTRAFYRRLVEDDGLKHKDALRDVLVSILMSPHFCYRLHESDESQPIHPLDDYELASRLSYFLWSSLPDEKLLELAGAKRLHDPSVLRAQVGRMLSSPKVRGLATEFGGNWLGFRHFHRHNSVDRQRFEQFDDTLREAMFEEPVRFTMDLIRRNQSVLEFLYGDYTFVNASLATHYGLTGNLEYDRSGWARVEAANRFGRGGILPMAVFLTKNSPGLRTSPVKRGFWVVRQLLGTHIPAPPPDVPELPEDESQLGDLTLRELLAKHRAHESCAGCHEKFDSVGLVFEGYGPVGQRRRRDMSGNPIDDSGRFPDGSQRTGIRGLREYLQERRQAEFVDTLCRKLLSYGLSRSLILSDEPLVKAMKRKGDADHLRFHTLVETIVLSSQFRNQRGTQFQIAY